jgi:hypothetical protein
MTTEERFARIEHVTAGLAEERRKDREENRQLWRDTQRHLNEVASRIAEVDHRLGERIEEVDVRLGARIEQLAEESRAEHKRLAEADKRLGERIETLVSAIGKVIASQKP